MAFTLPSLPYPTNALEPHIDKMTMEIHHGKHHKAYVDNLNKALEGQAALLTSRSSSFCAKSARCRRTFARPSSTMAAAMPITRCSGRSWRPRPAANPAVRWRTTSSTFSDFATVQDAAQGCRPSKRFGSGWAWLVLADGKLKITQHAEPGQSLHEQPGADPGRRCLGTRLLFEVPEQTPRLSGRLVERGQLERRGQALCRREGRQAVICVAVIRCSMFDVRHSMFGIIAPMVCHESRTLNDERPTLCGPACSSLYVAHSGPTTFPLPGRISATSPVPIAVCRSNGPTS